MNRADRRDTRGSAIRRLKKAKSFLVVTFDGNLMPIMQFDMTACNDTSDLRHHAMHQIVEDAVAASNAMTDVLNARIKQAQEAEKVKVAKEDRSLRLATA